MQIFAGQAAPSAVSDKVSSPAAGAAKASSPTLAQDRVVVQTQPKKFKFTVSALLGGGVGATIASAAATTATMAAMPKAPIVGTGVGGFAGTAGALAARKSDTLGGSIGYGAAAGAVAGGAGMFTVTALTKVYDVKSAAAFAVSSAVVGGVIGALAGATEHGVSKATDWAESRAKARGE